VRTVRPLEHTFFCAKYVHTMQTITTIHFPSLVSVDYYLVIFIYFVMPHVERVLENINSPLFVQMFDLPLT